MRPGNWQAIRAISSNTGADPNARLLPLPAGPVSTNTPKRQMENGLGLRDGSDSRLLQPRYPHHSGAFHQHALHGEAAAREKVRAVGQGGTQAAALQETCKDHHHRQWS